MKKSIANAAIIKSDGLECTNDTECDSGWCRTTKDGSKVCTAKLLKYAKCEGNEKYCGAGLKCSEETKKCINGK